jgi:hypothetical protein
VNTSWDPTEHLENASELVAEFHHDNAAKLKGKGNGVQFKGMRQLVSRYKEPLAQLFSPGFPVRCMLVRLTIDGRKGGESHDACME